MKGIMVPLLVFFMTGMVIGQQPQNGLSQAGILNRNAAQPRSVMERNVGSTTKGSADPGSVNQHGPLELVLSDQLISDFREKGQLSAPIKPQKFVNEIVLMHASRGTSKDVTGKMKPIVKQGDVLRFELDENDLKTLKTQGLKYTFDPFERGRYSKVKFDFRSAGAQLNGTNQVTQATSNRFGSPPTGPPSTYLPSPSPDYSRHYDPGYMGPTLPAMRTAINDTSFQNSNPTNNSTGWIKKPDLSNQVSSKFGSPQNSFPSTRSNRMSDISKDANGFKRPMNYQPRRQFNDASQFAVGNSTLGDSQLRMQPSHAGALLSPDEIRQERLQKLKADALQQSIQLEQRELAEIQENNRLKEESIKERQRQRLALQQQTRPGMTRQSANSFGAIDPNDAYNQFSAGSKQDRFASLTGSDYADRLVNGYNPPAEGMRNQGAQPTAHDGVRSYVGSIPGPQSANQRPDQLVTNPFDQKNVAGNVNKTDAPEAGILYFMLLFSLGLNVYLGWIARGFYVRYSELADELRETFTATM